MRTEEVSGMRRSMLRVTLSSVYMLAWIGVADAQFGRGSAEWMTVGGDAQRSFWIPSDPKISKAGLETPGFRFLWKVKFNNDPVQLNSLTPAVLMDRYIGYRGFRSLALLGGSSNAIYAVDTDLSRIEWQSRLPLPAPPAGSPGCPGGLTANIARATSAAYPPSGTGGGGGGRGGPASSAVGEPGEGAVTIAAALAAAASRAPAPNRGPNIRPPGLIYAVSGDGMLRSIYLSNGAEPQTAVKFLPPDSNAHGLIVLNGIAYAATGNCNGAASGVWALDLDSKQISNWRQSNGAIAGSAGPAFGPDGTVYATTTSGQLVALEPKTLKVKETNSTDGRGFASSPVVFPFKGKNLVAAATKDGRILLFDGAALGSKPVFETPAYSGTAFDSGALATWQAIDGVRWLLVPSVGAPAPGSGFSAGNGAVTHGAIVAWKVADSNGAISIEPGWVSRDLVSPVTPMILNGVVFALSSGEFRSDDRALSLSQRVQRSSPAVLYALDGATGQVLWDSGTTITSFVHSGGLSGGASELYVETFDETLYAFGFPIEH
jgi:outer membrane protein assembly factor BamB